MMYGEEIDLKNFDQKIVNFVLDAIKMQDQLNSKIDAKWKENRANKDFIRAIYVEAIEAINSTAWKWWKKENIDYDNLKIELVDIFHFLLSLIILLEEKYKINMYAQRMLIRDLCNGELNKNIDAIRNELELLVLNAIARDYTGIILSTSKLINAIFNNIDEFINFYKAKYLLNKLRNDYGYNSGTYNKYIDGIEDNKYLLQLVNSYSSIEVIENELRKLFEANGMHAENKENTNNEINQAIIQNKKASKHKQKQIEVEEI